MDLTRRTKTATAAKEIKASANYGYISNGITLDGSKFALSELVLEGQCLVKDNVTGKYEKYADADGAAPAVLLGGSAITPTSLAGLHANTIVKIKVNGNEFTLSNAGLKALAAALAVAKPAVYIADAAINNASLAGINAGTTVTLTINGKDYTVTNAVLAALAADSTDAVILDALETAVASDNSLAKDVAEFSLKASKIHIATRDVGPSQSIAITGTWGVAGDEAAVEGVFGINLPATTVYGANDVRQQLADAIGALALASGLKISDIANVEVSANKLRITTKDVGSDKSVSMSGTWGTAGDEATVEGYLGVALPAAAVTGSAGFPAGKSNPVILDESIQFELDDNGANPDVTAGQVLVWGAVYESMLVNCTSAFKAALAGAIRFIS
jgi:hypothetical protein